MNHSATAVSNLPWKEKQSSTKFKELLYRKGIRCMCSIKTERHKNAEKQNDLVLTKYFVVVIDYHNLDGFGILWSNHRDSAEY